MTQNQRDVEVLVLKCSEVSSPRMLAQGDRYATAKRTYHFNYEVMPAGVKPDIVVVRNNCPGGEPLSFPVGRERTVLMLSEPSSVIRFPADFVRQFGHVHSCQPEVSGPNVVHGPAAIGWYVGISLGGKLTPALEDAINYTSLKNSPLPRKTEMMSIIVSNKMFLRGHFARYKFATRLKARYGDKIDFYGTGFNYVEDKWDALAPYKYTIAIENSVSDTYFTEKISDAFLAGCHVVYSGCRRIGDYFPSEAISQIDITDFEGACRTIDSLLATDPYDASADAILRARDNVLEKYNMMHMIADSCDRVDLLATADEESVTIRPISGLGRLRNTFNHLVVWSAWNAAGSLYKLRQKLFPAKG